MKKIYAIIITMLGANLNSNAQGGFNQVVDPLNPITTFTTPGTYKGAAWIDYDNDNDLDLFASPNLLFRNDGGGTFVQLSNPFGFTPQQINGGSSWGDLNNDGFIDCIIASYPSGAFLNNGNGTFTDISSQIPNLNGFPAWACAIGDWNKDAFPDFVFAHAAGFHPAGPYPSKLYLNTSSAVIPQYITGYTLTDSTKPYTVPFWSDYDLDGDMDLFVASGPGGTAGPDFCYKNLKVETGLDTLQRMTTELFTTQLQDGQCYNFIDFDNDGDFDLYLTNYAGAPSRFYVNNSGVYTLMNVLPSQPQNLANDWGDFDNDGDIDVFVTNQVIATKYYKNNGNGTFAPAINFGAAGCSGVINGDYDNDGDLDVFIHGLGNARALYHNDSAATGNNWINIKCIGTISNKSAIGTIVKLKATINGNSYWQIREISAQNSFQSQNDLRVHFGLGNATIVDSLIIKYPGGTIETIANVAPNTLYCNQEGSGTLCFVTGINETKDIENKIKLYPNPANDYLNIELKKNSNAKEVQITIIDVCGKIVESKMFPIINQSVNINTGSLQAGIYLLQLRTQSFQYNSKFIKAEN